MNRYNIPLPEALKLAAQRRAERFAAIQADLDDLIAGGCKININAPQIIALEDAGLLYDFETGFVEDFTTAPDNPANTPALPVGAITKEIMRRRQSWQNIGQTAPASEHILLAGIEGRLQTYQECCDIVIRKVGLV